MGVTCALDGALNHAWLSIGALNGALSCRTTCNEIACVSLYVRDKTSRCVETLTEEDSVRQPVREKM